MFLPKVNFPESFPINSENVIILLDIFLGDYFNFKLMYTHKNAKPEYILNICKLSLTKFVTSQTSTTLYIINNYFDMKI